MKCLIAASVIAAALALTACGGDDDAAGDSGSHPSTTTAATQAGQGDQFNEADVVFVQRMIVHHEQAVEMARIARDAARGAGAAVVDLAARVEAAQAPEIATMTDWLTAWGEPMDTSGHDMSTMPSMPGMMSAADMDSLGALSGADFDQQWLTMMVQHHEGAIDMAIAVHDDGSNPDVKVLAQEIVTAQQAEIDEMQTLLQG
jgi:uncharacterized protein (DUF305 family)